MHLKHWLGGNLSEMLDNPRHIRGQQAWHCFSCGREAPYSWWRIFTGRA